jgi:ATP-dependent protease HslVU (ClpYQ) peptidase subunit
MTTLVGIQGDGFAVVGADALITSYDETGNAYQKSVLGSGSSKISTNGKYVLGAAGDVRAINILQHAFQPPTPAPGLRGKKLDSFVTVKFIPALRACFDQHGYSPPDSKDSKDHIAQHDSTILVVVNSTIYMIEGDYSWINESTGFYVAGTGGAYALGALQAISDGKKLTLEKAKLAVGKALTIAAKFDPNSGPPYQTIIQSVDKPAAPRK